MESCEEGMRGAGDGVSVYQTRLTSFVSDSLQVAAVQSFLVDQTACV